MEEPSEIYTLLQQTIIKQDSSITPFLQKPPQGSIADRVAIYTNGYYARLEEALLSDFDTLSLLMGEEDFSLLSEGYVKAYPSHGYSLNSLGKHLRQYLSESKAYEKKPYLAEVAAFEWAEAEAFIAAEKPIQTHKDLEQVPPEAWPELRFCLHPSCQIVTFNWNAFALIDALRRGHSVKAKPLPRPQSVMIWRGPQEVDNYLLNNTELIALQAIQAGANFIGICEQLLADIDETEVANYLVARLYRWLGEGWFVVSNPRGKDRGGQY